MTTNLKVKILLCLVIFVASLLRLVNLDKIPVALTIDEVAVGYNSYSILKTGRDEHGIFLPLTFKSIGDYKSPLAIYITIPSIAIFGLNEVGTRLPTALFGVATVFLTFYLTKLLLNNNSVALFAAFSLAISPWHIKPSRMTHDGTLGLFFVILAVIFFVKYIKKGGWFLTLSGIAFTLSLYSYHAEKIFTPILIGTLFVIHNKELLKKKSLLITPIIVSTLLLTPLILITLTPQGRTRANMTFITQDNEINNLLKQAPQQLLDNNLITTLNFWSKRYLDYFDFRFLFTKGMAFSYPNSPDIGLMHLFELPLVILGFYYLAFRGNYTNKLKLLIIGWLLIGPLPASLANNAQHHFRSMTMMPIPQILSGLGFFYILELFKGNRIRSLFIASTLLITILGVGYFITLYSINHQVTFSETFGDGWKQATQFGLAHRNDYTEIVIDPRFGITGPTIIGTPYMYVLFYGAIDPKIYQKSPRRTAEYSSDFGNFTFREIDWRENGHSDRQLKQTLFIGSPWVLPIKSDSSNGKILGKFSVYNGKALLYAVIN